MNLTPRQKLIGGIALLAIGGSGVITARNAQILPGKDMLQIDIMADASWQVTPLRQDILGTRPALLPSQRITADGRVGNWHSPASPVAQLWLESDKGEYRIARHEGQMPSNAKAFTSPQGFVLAQQLPQLPGRSNYLRLKPEQQPYLALGAPSDPLLAKNWRGWNLGNNGLANKMPMGEVANPSPPPLQPPTNWPEESNLDGTTNWEEREARYLSVLAASPSGAKLVQLAASTQLPINDKLNVPNSIGAYRADGMGGEARQLAMHDGLPSLLTLITMAHELTHAYQDAQGLLIAQKIGLKPFDQVMHLKLIEAAADTNAIRIIYELQQAGALPLDLPIPPNSMEAQMLMAFRDAVTADNMALIDGRADRAAFDAWFDNVGNRASYEANSLRESARFLEMGMPMQRRLDERDLRLIGGLPNGSQIFSNDAGAALNDPRYRALADFRVSEEFAALEKRASQAKHPSSPLGQPPRPGM